VTGELNEEALMPEKTPGGPLPKQTGTTQKGQAAPGKGSQPVQVNPNFKGGGSGKGGGGGKK
jgi:hypothetical protein